MLILFSGEAKNCKLHVSKNEVKLLEIKLNRASLFEKKRGREREREAHCLHFTKVNIITCLKRWSINITIFML